MMKTKTKKADFTVPTVKAKVTITTDKNGMKKIKREVKDTCKQVLRAQAPESLLDLIRRRCYLIEGVAKILNQYTVSIKDASILLQDPEEGKTYWLYQALEEHIKIFVNKKFIPTLIGNNIPVDPPKDQHIDITFMEPLPGHIISIDCTAWKREGAGAQKMA